MTEKRFSGSPYISLSVYEQKKIWKEATQKEKSKKKKFGYENSENLLQLRFVLFFSFFFFHIRLHLNFFLLDDDHFSLFCNLVLFIMQEVIYNLQVYMSIYHPFCLMNKYFDDGFNFSLSSFMQFLEIAQTRRQSRHRRLPLSR